VKGGIERVLEWISCLVDLQGPFVEPVPPLKRIKTEAEQVSLTPAFSDPTPTPDVAFLTPRPNSSNPLAPAQPNSPFLPLFNRAASQRHAVVEYTYSFSGPSHAGLWTVNCIGKSTQRGRSVPNIQV